jgi:hypothetical protein
MTRTWRAVGGLVIGVGLVGLATVTSGAGQADVAERHRGHGVDVERPNRNAQVVAHVGRRTI